MGRKKRGGGNAADRSKGWTLKINSEKKEKEKQKKK